MPTATMQKPKRETNKGMDVSDRLKAFTAQMMYLSASLPDDLVGQKLGRELLDRVIGAFMKHGEAEGAPSAKEFAEKFRECLCELRKARRILQLVEATSVPCDGQAVRDGQEDLDVLIRIFFSSIRTLENKAS